MNSFITSFIFKSVFFKFSILSELRFVRDVLLRNRIGASIKLKTCETGSNFTSFDDNISKFSIKFKSIPPFFSTANTKKLSYVKILL